VDNSCSGEVVLVAGGTGGLGRAVSLAFLEQGAKVVVPWHDADEFAALKSAVGAHAYSLRGRQVDVTDESDVCKFVVGIIAEHGRLDVLVNTVGGYAGGVNLWEPDSSVFDRILALNLRAGFVLSHAAVVPMLRQRRGAIVNVSATAAFDHASGAAAYAASKAAALAMIDCLAADTKGTGVRVNSILPSIIDTAANRREMPNSNFAIWPKPEDIARVILFLCSDQARVIHGAAIPVYGDS
jgi:NAD(P)-dependent dehydrogenase (short-subunit alcohol dehydrogenase family)